MGELTSESQVQSDFVTKTLTLPYADEQIKVKIWDSANKDNAVPKKVMRRCHGFIVVVDVTSDSWQADVRAIVDKLAYENRKDAPRVLVANKIDLPDRAFSVIEGHALAQELQFDDFFEVSVAKRVNC